MKLLAKRAELTLPELRQAVVDYLAKHSPTVEVEAVHVISYRQVRILIETWPGGCLEVFGEFRHNIDTVR